MGSVIVVKGLEEALQKLEFIPPIKEGLEAALLIIQGKMRKYPSQQTGRKQPPKTQRQRLFLFHAIERGDISLPYRRGSSSQSQKLGQSFTTEVNVYANRFEGKVGSAVPYGKYVMGDRQSRFHQHGGWENAEEIAKALAESGEVTAAITKHLQEAINSG